MFDFFQKSLRNKLVVTFIFIGFLPFTTLLVYTIFLSETKIVNKIIYEQFDKTDSIDQLINDKINSLEKEVKFLASLDVMDDILADDIDKKISRLLTQKSEDLNSKNNFMVVNSDSIVISASIAKDILQKNNIKKIIQNDKNTYLEDKTLYIYSNVYASFDKTKKIGVLILKYDLNNFDVYLTNKADQHSYLVNPTTNHQIGAPPYFNLDYAKDKDSVIESEHLIVYKKMDNILNETYIVYGVDKSVALAFLYDFIRFMIYVSIPIFVVIIYVSIKYAKGIVRPIEELTYATDEITKTQNYSAKLSVDSKDEIATLTNSFNTMLQTTSTALNNLEEENKLRLKRFIQLIEVFNTIIQTKDEEECVNTSIEQIKLLTGERNQAFQKNKFFNTNKAQIPLFTTNFETNEKTYLRTIELGFDKFYDENEQKFYHSIGAMITLQLDKIKLIERTMSASRAKSAFISNMSHELRTPLNAIIGFTQFMITYEDLTDDQQDTMSNIESSAHYLLNMINEILDIAKIEAGKMEARIEEVNVLNLVNNAYNMLKPLASDKNLEFTLSADCFEDKEYQTDPKMFQQILINLLSNSIKFTETGSVSIELSNEENNVLVKIKDTGIGISKEDVKLLFNDFTQVENIMQKKHKGTGLGLSLSKKMATILNGDVKLESEGLGFGSVSTFTIRT